MLDEPYKYPASDRGLLQGTAVVCAWRDNIFLASKYQRYFRLGCEAVWVGTEEGLPKYTASRIRRQ